jgi:hypothetical protein
MGRIPSLAAQYYPITPAWPAGSPRVAGKTSLAVGPTYQPLGARALVTWPPTCGPHWSVASSTEAHPTRQISLRIALARGRCKPSPYYPSSSYGFSRSSSTPIHRPLRFFPNLAPCPISSVAARPDLNKLRAP